MGLLTTEVEIKWHAGNKKYYESKGYNYTGIGTILRVKTKDLSKATNTLVEVKCDNCNKILIVRWYDYIKCLHTNELSYCQKCAHKLLGVKKSNKSKLLKSKSFQKWCIENHRQDVLDRWDYLKNTCNPDEISYGTTIKYWFKCPFKLHDSELKNINSFVSGQEGSMNCIACNSIGQYLITLYGEDAINIYWSDKNILNPFELPKFSIKKIWIKCQEKDYHGSYQIICSTFTLGSRCPYCINHKVHPLDSLGTLFPESLKYWSDKNKKSPFEYSSYSSQKVWWKCPDGKHKDFQRRIASSNLYNFRCSLCNFSKGEKRIEDYLASEQINNIPQKEFDGLIGVGNGQLSYDFYLPTYNLLIEYQGEYHDGTAYNQTNKELVIQKEHDKRKKQYTIDNNINFLEIWYWDFENIDEILNNKLKGEINEYSKL